MTNNSGNNLHLYKSIKAKAISAFNQNKLEKSLDYTRAAALLAWQCHCGLWYDSELEILLKIIGSRLDESVPVDALDIKVDAVDAGEAEDNSGKRIVYITSALNVGGLTILLNQWINLLKNDFEKKVVYVTNSYTSKNPFYCTETTFSDSELEFYNLSHQKKYTDRIKELIKLLNDVSPDYIVLFIDPDDVVAVSAVNALNGHPRVIYVNHTDHAFWLGSGVIDNLACFRREGAIHAERYRDINNNFVIPISTNIKPKNSFSKEDFDINEEATISLSVGTFPKVLGDKGTNYFHTITQLLEQFPNHYHFLITNPPDITILENYLPDNLDLKKRFIVDGPFSDLSGFYQISDFLIETFPITGYTVQVEAMASKLPIVAFKNKFPLFSSTGNLSFYPFTASTESEIIKLSAKLIENPELRKKLGNCLYDYYSKELNLDRSYRLLKGMLNGESQLLASDSKITKPYTYDIDDVQMFNCRNFRLHKQLILQSILKKSSFRVKERFKFYCEALKRKEFGSKKEMFGYIVPVIFGSNPLQ